MFRPALRIASPAFISRVSPKTRAARRFISTAPPHQKSRSWKSSAARWGLAGALVYYYNTTNVFAEEPSYVHVPPETSQESETIRTVASVSEQRRAQSRTQSPESAKDDQGAAYAVPDNENPAPGSPEELEQEASQEGAFNEETGEINWDCPCLGGMAYGPCGEQFRAAFSCFVFSQEEPKGVDCIEHFKAMQNCFREHPDIYGAELDDDEEGSAEYQAEQPVATTSEPPATPEAKPITLSSEPSSSSNISQAAVAGDVSSTTAPEQRERAQAATEQVKRDYAATSDDDEQVPKSWHDARTSNQTA